MSDRSPTRHGMPVGTPTGAGVVFCAAMRWEADALRRGLRPELRDAVVCTGIGPRRASRAAAAPPVRDGDAVVVVGIAGGLDPSLQVGDIVVADRVMHADSGTAAVSSPSARLLAARFSALGLPARIGTIATADHLVTDSERRALAAAGAIAVDMETGYLLPADRAGIAVRVIADTAREPLLRPATLGRVRQALKTITMLGPALTDWAAAAGERTVLLAEPRSFCAGVERAIDIVERALVQRGAPVYVRKQIVHNQHVVSDLANRGAVFVDDLDEVPPGATVVFSAHGVSPAVWTQARGRGLDIIDATCPLVMKVHSEVRRFSDRGDTVIFIGHAGHEETEGTMGERPGRTVLVENTDDAATVQLPDPERASYLVQTTLASHEVDGIVEVLRSRFSQLKAPPTDDICYATTNRQEALREVAAQSDLLLVVGSQNSSNSLRLVEAAERFGATAHLVDDVDDVDLRWLAGVRTVGLTAGASAPAILVDEVVAALGGLGPVDVQTRQLVTENVHFTLPKEVRGL